MRTLITGAAGFTARHLAKLLLTNHKVSAEDNEIYFTSLQKENPDYCSNYISCDLRQFEAVYSLIISTKPDQIYHLAGTFTNDFSSDYAANVQSTKNILDAVLKVGINVKILLVGSAAEYGAVDLADNPISEDHPLRPVSIYGLTKVFQTQLMEYYCRAYNLNIVMARTFNIFGPGMSNRLFVGRIQEQIKKYKRHEISTITVGNLNNWRNYLPIEDVVNKYLVIMGLAQLAKSTMLG